MHFGEIVTMALLNVFSVAVDDVALSVVFKNFVVLMLLLLLLMLLLLKTMLLECGCIRCCGLEYFG